MAQRTDNRPTEKVLALVPSAGMGRRMGEKKTLIQLQGRPLIFHTLDALERTRNISSIILVVPSEDVDEIRGLLAGRYEKLWDVVAGGERRQDSVRKGLDHAPPGFSHVVVHDGARPLVTPEIIERTIEAAKAYGAAVSAVPLKDTVKEVSEGFIRRTIPRGDLMAAQTPQAFELELLKKAHSEALEKGVEATDCSSLVEMLGHRVKIVEGSYENIKITTREDLVTAGALLRKRKAAG